MATELIYCMADHKYVGHFVVEIHAVLGTVGECGYMNGDRVMM